MTESLMHAICGGRVSVDVENVGGGGCESCYTDGTPEATFHCDTCHKTWKDDEVTPVEPRDILSIPKKKDRKTSSK